MAGNLIEITEEKSNERLCSPGTLPTPGDSDCTRSGREKKMNSTQILKALERERTLLEDFICVSEEQLLLLEDENIDAVDSLLEKRADLIMELTAIEATLGTWIAQIRTDPAITPQMVKEFRDVNDEIVCMANHIMEIDDQTHARLDMIRERVTRKQENWHRSGQPLHLCLSPWERPGRDRGETAGEGRNPGKFTPKVTAIAAPETENSQMSLLFLQNLRVSITPNSSLFKNASDPYSGW